jgi:hypothetical protein
MNAHIRFTPFAEEQVEALKVFAQLPGLREIMETLARDGHQQDERGLIIWRSTSGLTQDLQPPVFQSAASWRRTPLLINTPHPDLLEALSDYNPQDAYIMLVASGDSESSPTTAHYTWWIQPFTKKPKVGFG